MPSWAGWQGVGRGLQRRYLLATHKPIPGEEPPDIPGARAALETAGFAVESASECWLRLQRPKHGDFNALALRGCLGVVVPFLKVPRGTALLVKDALGSRPAVPVAWWDPDQDRFVDIGGIYVLNKDDWQGHFAECVPLMPF